MYDDPVNAGIFVIEPKVGIWSQLEQMFNESQARLQKEHSENVIVDDDAGIGPWGKDADLLLEQSPYKLWNYYDQDDGSNTRDDGTKYNYYCSQSDQGLLYYFLKFIVQDVSIIVGNTIEHYYSNGDDEEGRRIRKDSVNDMKPGIPLKRTTPNFLNENSCLPPIASSSSLPPTMNKYYNNPAMSMVDEATKKRLITYGLYRDFHHAVGFGKLWEQYKRPKQSQDGNSNSNNTPPNTTADYWFWILRHVLNDVIGTANTNGDGANSGQQHQRQQKSQLRMGKHTDRQERLLLQQYVKSIIQSLDDGTFLERNIGPPVHGIGRGDLLTTVKKKKNT